MPTSYSGIYCGGPWFSRQPNRGCSPEEAESIKTGTDTVIKDWDEFCANQDRKEKERIPETLEPFFFRIVEERDRYNVEYKAITAWPAQWKETTGKYPTWGEIAKQFTVFGDYFKSLLVEPAEDNPFPSEDCPQCGAIDSLVVDVTPDGNAGRCGQCNGNRTDEI